MADEPIKRLRYFTGQFLEAADFATEQSFHINLRRRGNQALYLAGILDGGFNVTYLSSERKIQISPGVGVDAQGRELVIVSPVTESPPSAGTHFVTLTYQEIETDLQNQTGADAVSEKTRFDETPKVKFFPDGTNIDKGTFIVIAKVTVDNAGTVSGIDPSVRQYAEGRFPSSLTVGQGGNGVLNTRHIDGKDWRNDNKDDLFLNWATGKNVHLGFGAGTRSSLFVSGNVGIGTSSPSQRLQVTGGNGIVNNVFLGDVGHGQDWAGLSHTNATSTTAYGFLHHTSGQYALINKKSGAGWIGFRVDNVDRMVISDTGNVGIGTTTPTSGKLQFENNLGNKVVIYDNGQTDRYGFGLNGGNLNAFVPAGGRFSIRQNGYDGTEVMSITGKGDTLRVSNSSNEGPRLLLHNPQKTGLGNEWAIYNMTGGYGDSLQFWNYGGNGWGSKLTIKDSGSVGIGTMTPRANLEVLGGGILNGIAVGVDPPPIPGVGDITFPFAYETIGTIDPRHNLRLHSNGQILFHTGNDQSAQVSIDTSGRVGTNGYAPGGNAGLAGGVTTWDVIAWGTIWCANIVYAKRGTVQLGDLAENYPSDLELEAGDVVCLDYKEDQIVKSERANDTLLLGVISTSPGLLLGGQHSEENRRSDGKRAYPVALSGRVPCKVTDENGPITRGDVLTSSSTPGHAMKAMPLVVGGVEIYAPGTIIGKALESFSSGTGTIDIFVTLR